MPKLPLTAPVFNNTSKIKPGEVSAELWDGYVDDADAIVSRPGLALWRYQSGATATSGIRGVFWWDEVQRLIYVIDAGIYWLATSEDSPNLISGAYPLTGSASRANFAKFYDKATNTNRLVIADGGRAVVVAVQGASITPAYLDAIDAAWPATISFVVNIDGFLLASETDTNTFHASEVNDETNWGYQYDAVYSLDKIDSMVAWEGEAFLFGNESIEIWQDDAVNPFSRSPGGAIDRGCLAPLSVIKGADGLYWLDGRGKFASWNGSLALIRCPYEKEIGSLSYLEDCIGNYLDYAGYSFLIWSFPSAGVTYVAKQEGDGFRWSKWGKWDSSQNKYLHWLGVDITYVPIWNLNIVGHRASPCLLSLTDSQYWDYDPLSSGNKSYIRLKVVTGHVTYDSLEKKISNRVIFKLLRGEADQRSDTTYDPILAVRWQDDGEERWSNERHLSLGQIGKRTGLVRLHRNGIYTMRQWEIVVSDQVPVSIVEAEEDIEAAE